MASSLPPLPPSYVQANQGYPAQACAIAFIAIAVCFSSLKVLARAVTRTRLGWDDWLLIPSLVSFLVECATIIYMVQHAGAGRHVAVLAEESPATIVLFVKVQLVYIGFYILAILLPKLVVLSYYLRFFLQRGRRIVCWGLVGLILVYFCIAAIITMTECIPIQALWDTTITDAKCIDIHAWWIYSTLPTLALDLVLLYLPIPVIWKLQLPLRDKIGIIATFLFGLCGTAAAAARVAIFATTTSLDDPTWYFTPLGITGIVECGTYFIAACIPGIRPLYLWFRKGHYTRRGTTGYGGSANIPTPYRGLGDGGASSRSKSGRSGSHPGNSVGIKGHTYEVELNSAERDDQPEQPGHNGIVVTRGYSVGVRE